MQVPHGHVTLTINAHAHVSAPCMNYIHVHVHVVAAIEIHVHVVMNYLWEQQPFPGSASLVEHCTSALLSTCIYMYK